MGSKSDSKIYNYVKKNKLKNLELSNLIKSLEWTIKISKGNKDQNKHAV